MSFSISNSVFRSLGISSICHLGHRRQLHPFVIAQRQARDADADADADAEPRRLVPTGSVFWRCDGFSDEDIDKYHIGNQSCEHCPDDARSANILASYEGLEESRDLLFCEDCHSILVTLSQAGIINRDDLERLEEVKLEIKVVSSTHEHEHASARLNIHDPLRLATHSSLSNTVIDFL